MRLRRQPDSHPHPAREDRSVPALPPAGRKPLAAAVALAAVVMAVYLATLNPGPDRGDAAELQYACALGGVCHPPGYQIEVAVGWLFHNLPLGRGPAWRINLMMAVFGTIGVLALYGTVRRITGQISAGLIGAGVLAFSSIYWEHCTLAEAYVFYGMFLLLGMYALQRFVESDKASWLILGTASLGVCVADRSSELFVLPAFLFLWAAYRKKVHLTRRRVLWAAAAFVAPFVFTVSSYLVHSDPGRLAYRDTALRDRILRGDRAVTAPPDARLAQAVRYCLGLMWTENAMRPHKQLIPDVKRYAFQLIGVSLLTPDAGEDRQMSLEEGPGAGIGLPGLLLAVFATVAVRRYPGWVLLGWGIFAGNLAFYLWHHRWDGLTFTVPGLVGVSLLVGLGAATPRGWTTSPVLRTAVCFVAPVFLLAANYRLVDRSTAEDHERMRLYDAMAAAPLPRNAVVLTTYWPAMTFRYLYHIQAGRTDIRVISAEPEQIRALAAHFTKAGVNLFVLREHLGDSPKATPWLEQTHADILRIGLVQISGRSRSLGP